MSFGDDDLRAEEERFRREELCEPRESFPPKDFWGRYLIDDEELKAFGGMTVQEFLEAIGCKGMAPWQIAGFERLESKIATGFGSQILPKTEGTSPTQAET